MSYIEWVSEFQIGVPEMDDQHKKLIETINFLYDKHQANASKMDVMGAFDRLMSYAQKHFKNEEDLMEKIAFPNVQTHKLTHDRFIRKMKTYYTDFQTTQDRLPDGFFTFLKVWVSSHFKGIDAKYAEHMAARKSA